jgi:hypothetical protein
MDRSLFRDQPGTGPPGERLASDVRRLTSALREVRQLLAQHQETSADSEDPARS